MWHSSHIDLKITGFLQLATRRNRASDIKYDLELQYWYSSVPQSHISFFIVQYGVQFEHVMHLHLSSDWLGWQSALRQSLPLTTVPLKTTLTQTISQYNLKCSAFLTLRKKVLLQALVGPVIVNNSYHSQR